MMNIVGKIEAFIDCYWLCFVVGRNGGNITLNNSFINVIRYPFNPCPYKNMRFYVSIFSLTRSSVIADPLGNMYLAAV